MKISVNSLMKDRAWLLVLISAAALILAALILGSLQGAAANGRDTYGPACGRPVVDGEVNDLEWSAAYSQTIQLQSGSVPDNFTATLRVMNTANNLYLGLTIDDDEFTTQAQYLTNGDGFRIDFDNDHGSALFTVDDDVLSIYAGGAQFFDSYIDGDPAPSSADEDVAGGGTTDGDGAASRVGDLNHFEVKHPLCSGDDKDFCLSPASFVGFRLEYFDAQGDGSFGGSFRYPGTSDTDQADIEISNCSIPDLYFYLPLAMNN